MKGIVKVTLTHVLLPSLLEIAMGMARSVLHVRRCFSLSLFSRFFHPRSSNKKCLRTKWQEG